MSNTISHYIQGQMVAGQSTRQQPVTNPATGAVTAQVKLGSVADVNAAVASAQAAFPAWSDLPPLRRARRCTSVSGCASGELAASVCSNSFQRARISGRRARRRCNSSLSTPQARGLAVRALRDACRT